MHLLTAISYLLFLILIWYLLYRRQIISLVYGRQEFKCTRCGHCCRLFVKLSKDDIARLGKSLKPGYLNKVHGITYLRQINGYCPFLSLNKGMAACDVYEHRPEICKNFPRIRILRQKAHDYRCRAFKLPKYLF